MLNKVLIFRKTKISKVFSDCIKDRKNDKTLIKNKHCKNEEMKCLSNTELKSVWQFIHTNFKLFNIFVIFQKHLFENVYVFKQQVRHITTYVNIPSPKNDFV